MVAGMAAFLVIAWLAFQHGMFQEALVSLRQMNQQSKYLSSEGKTANQVTWNTLSGFISPVLSLLFFLGIDILMLAIPLLSLVLAAILVRLPWRTFLQGLFGLLVLGIEVLLAKGLLLLFLTGIAFITITLRMKQSRRRQSAWWMSLIALVWVALAYLFAHGLLLLLVVPESLSLLLLVAMVAGRLGWDMQVIIWAWEMTLAGFAFVIWTIPGDRLLTLPGLLIAVPAFWMMLLLLSLSLNLIQRLPIVRDALGIAWAIGGVPNGEEVLPLLAARLAIARRAFASKPVLSTILGKYSRVQMTDAQARPNPDRTIDDDVLRQALLKARSIQVMDERAKRLRVLMPELELHADQHRKLGYDLWRDTFHLLATRNRRELLSDLGQLWTITIIWGGRRSASILLKEVRKAARRWP